MSKTTTFLSSHNFVLIIAHDESIKTFSQAHFQGVSGGPLPMMSV